MQDYQKRVVEEANDLKAKLGRLDAFIGSTDAASGIIPFEALDERDRENLTQQAYYMNFYLAILFDRIGRF